MGGIFKKSQNFIVERVYKQTFKTCKNIFSLTETGTATLTLTRRGLYGTIHVPWGSGLPSGSKPEWYTEGQITPSSGSLTVQHGIQSRNFTISVSCFVKIRFFNHEDKKKWGVDNLHIL